MYDAVIKIRSKLLVYLTHNMALPFLKLVRKPMLFPYSMDMLLQMKGSTVGNDLYHFLTKRNLQLLPYYAKHDIKHILLEYDTTDEGEVCLQCFMLGNGHLSFPVAATVLYGFITMPEYWHKFKAAYSRGSKAAKLKEWNWFEMMGEQTQVLKDKINFKTKYHAKIY